MKRTTKETMRKTMKVTKTCIKRAHTKNTMKTEMNWDANCNEEPHISRCKHCWKYAKNRPKKDTTNGTKVWNRKHHKIHNKKDKKED